METIIAMLATCLLVSISVRLNMMFLRILDRLEEWSIAILMAAATMIIFVAVVHRYAATLAIPDNINQILFQYGIVYNLFI